jgi:hypothetical protein
MLCFDEVNNLSGGLSPLFDFTFEGEVKREEYSFGVLDAQIFEQHLEYFEEVGLFWELVELSNHLGNNINPSLHRYVAKIVLKYVVDLFHFAMVAQHR